MTRRRLRDWFVPLRRKHVENKTDAKRSLLRDERGATYVEYVTILVLVAVAGMSAWYLWKQAVKRDASDQYTTFGTPPE